MGYPLTSEAGAITVASALADLAYLFGTAVRQDQNGATITIGGSAIDITEASASGVNMMAKMGGLRDVSIDWNGIFNKAAPKLGVSGSLTFATQPPFRLQDYTLNIEWPEVETTGPEGTANGYRRFQPGGVGSWSGTFTTLQDSANAPGIPMTENTAATATFKLAEAGASDPALSGNILITQLVQTVKITDQLIKNTYAFSGSGDLTQANGGLFAASGAITKPLWDTNSDGTGDNIVTFQAASGRVWTAPMFWTGVSIRLVANDSVKVTGRLRASEALTAVG